MDGSLTSGEQALFEATKALKDVTVEHRISQTTALVERGRRTWKVTIDNGYESNSVTADIEELEIP